MADPSIEGLPPEVKAAFALLRDRFVAGLPRRWQEIEAAGSGPALEAALHRLVGAAASYGLGRLGEAAQQAEGLARMPVVQGQPDPSAVPGPVPAGALAAALADVKRRMDDAGTVP